MNRAEQDRYAALSEWAESEAALDVPGTITRRPEGAGADPETVAMLVQAAEDDPEAMNMIGRAVGRPRLGGRQSDGASPRRALRLPAHLSVAVDELAEAQGRKPSALMRDAIEQYVAAARRDAAGTNERPRTTRRAAR